MYKVLLVDDEILIRENIAERIPWNDIGFDLFDSCENGKDAIEILKENKIDLVLTDIRMPYVDGLELTKYIYEEKLPTKVIIISGYDDFNYAKQAIKYQVIAYILKPITAKEMIDTLSNTKAIFDKDQTVKNAIRENNILYEENFQILRHQFLQQLIKGKATNQEIEDKAKRFRVNLIFDIYSVALLYIDNDIFTLENNNKEIFERIQNYIAELLDEQVIVFPDGEEKLAVILGSNNPKNANADFMKLCSMLEKAILENLHYRVIFLLGTAVSRPIGLSVSYQKVLEIKEYLYLESDNNVLEWEKYKKSEADCHKEVNWNKWEGDILIAIKSNLIDEIEGNLDLIVEDCRNHWLKKSKIIMQMHSFVLQIMEFFEKLAIQDEELFQEQKDLISKLYDTYYLSQTKELILKFCLFAAAFFSKKRGGYCERQAMFALTYINENYGNSELTLQSLCSELAISVSYFSSIFKEHTGMTFVEALIRRRMEKAKEFLKHGTYKTYEVAEKCGYKDSNYFSATFKKYTGLTPKEYIKQNK